MPVQSINGLVDRLHEDLDEALKSSAPMQWQQAVLTCRRGESPDLQDCTAYHRIWQYLVLWKLTTSMRPDSAFILDNILKVVRADQPKRILISGTADYALLAHVLRACQAEQVAPAITVLDQCMTSLNINTWYARREGFETNAVQGDIFSFEPEAEYDAILTHSFLIWFSPEQQYRLIQKWYSLLKPGGKVLTTLRLREGVPGVPSSFSEQEARELQQRTRNAATAHQYEHQNNPELMGEVAYEFAIRRKRYAGNDPAIYRNMLERAGFTIESANVIVSPDSRTDRPSGPATGSGGRLQIVAIRN